MPRPLPRQRQSPRHRAARRGGLNRVLLRARAGVRRRRRRVRHAATGTFATARAWARKAFLVVWTLFIYALWLACWPISLVNEGPMRGIRRAIHRLWGRGLLWGLGARVTISGPRPQPPFFLVANHLSYIDAFLLAGAVGGAFVARADMAHWPIFGWMMRNAYQVFIDREDMKDANRVLGLIGDVLDKNDGVILFPEAGCQRGTHVLPFKPAMFQIAALRQQPVSCATISYATPPGYPAAGDDVVWWRHEPFGAHFERLLRLPYFHATLHFAEQTVLAPDRKQMAARAHAEIARRYVPVEQGHLPELPPPPKDTSLL